MGSKGAVANAQDISDSIIYSYNFIMDDKEDSVIDYVLKGMVVAIFSNDKKYFAVNIKKAENRGVETPELTFTLRGPRDCLNENLDVSLSLIRYRIKDAKLNVDIF